MFFKILTIFTGLTFLTTLVFGQILDDTTQTVYGPETTKITNEINIKYELDNWWGPDTTLNNFHRFNYVDNADHKLVNLGILGTSMRPMFYEMPDVIGITSGFKSFDRYFKSVEDFTYFDTKSPFINLDIVFAGDGRSVTDVLATRNINPNINIGLHFRKLAIDKQIGGGVRRGDRRVESTSYDAFGSFRTGNDKYKALWHFSRMKHIVFESGGVAFTDSTRIIDLFEDEATARLQNAESKELRRTIHLYHEFKVHPIIKIYHSIDRHLQTNDFNMIPVPLTGIFKIPPNIDNDTTQERSEFNYWQNELGVKGKVNNIFYNFFYKRKDIDFRYKYRDSLNLDFPTTLVENYGGFRVRYSFDSVFHLSGKGEFLQGGNYNLGAALSHPLFHIDARTIQYKPSFLYKAYFGNHDIWNNDFTDIKASELGAHLNLKAGSIGIRPGLTYTRLKDYIFFNQDTVPEQFGNNIEILSPSLGMEFKFLKYFYLDTEFIVTDVNQGSKEPVRIPEIFANGKIFFENIVFGGVLGLRVGFDVHWHSSYFGHNYHPVVQQFFLQDDLKLPSTLAADLFLNGKIGNAKIFFKLINLDQLINVKGYLTAPYYIGQPSAIDFGFQWLFFD